MKFRNHAGSLLRNNILSKDQKEADFSKFGKEFLPVVKI